MVATCCYEWIPLRYALSSEYEISMLARVASINRMSLLSIRNNYLLQGLHSAIEHNGTSLERLHCAFKYRLY